MLRILFVKHDLELLTTDCFQFRNEEINSVGVKQ